MYLAFRMYFSPLFLFKYCFSKCFMIFSFFLLSCCGFIVCPYCVPYFLCAIFYNTHIFYLLFLATSLLYVLLYYSDTTSYWFYLFQQWSPVLGWFLFSLWSSMFKLCTHTEQFGLRRGCSSLKKQYLPSVQNWLPFAKSLPQLHVKVFPYKRYSQSRVGAKG